MNQRAPIECDPETSHIITGLLTRPCQTRATTNKYKDSLKLLIPIRLKPRSQEPSPLDQSGFLSYVWMSWMSPLFYKAYKSTLEYGDLWTIPDNDRGEINGKRSQEPSPLDQSGFLSYVWMSWMSPLFYKAYKSTLEYGDLWTISDNDRGEINGKR
eukprot:XP_011678080.1 PREDICTED: multidrug resistance-associated protein 9-like [Strongylocentrotus purpuratus]